MQIRSWFATGKLSPILDPAIGDRALMDGGSSLTPPRFAALARARPRPCQGRVDAEEIYAYPHLSIRFMVLEFDFIFTR
jgi:hypothetical protein